MFHSSDPNITFDVKIRPAEKKSGEFMYSLGSPPVPEKKFIEAVYYKGVDITEFVNDHCDSLFDKWEEQIND